MRRTLGLVFAALLVLSVPAPGSAQLLAAKDGPIVYGHHHLNASSIEEHKKFWADTLGGTAAKVGANNLDVIRFPNVWLFMRSQAPKGGGSKGTTVNHVGFSVPDLRQIVDRVKANGFRMITRDEVAADQEVKDDIAVLGRSVAIAFVMAPDDVKVELVENRNQTTPIALHHVHFFGPQNEEMRAWYVKAFGATARSGGGAFLAADLPGVALNFSPTTEPVVGTTGRALDHIGFEVRDLEAFMKQLEAEGITPTVTYRRIEALDTAIAFITDPWGTLIELSDGLAKLP